VKQQETNFQCGRNDSNRHRGFSLLEMTVVIALILIVSAIAVIKLQPVLQDAKVDVAMRQVLDQLRQAREYSIANRRYVQVTFPIVVVGGKTQYQIVTTIRNDLTAGGGPANPVMSTVPIQYPGTFLSFGGVDTPDGYGNAAAIEFAGVSGGPAAGMMFQSDGELVAGGTYLPINGTVFIGVAAQPTSARAITVLGTTGRIRAWKTAANAASWVQF
jgi:prepilin-type N-terminal cleavage/methylation domain-containing protein